MQPRSLAAVQPHTSRLSHCAPWLERVLFFWVMAVGFLALAGCSTTQFFEREKLNDRAAQFDQDGGLNYLRQKIEAAREGSLGGFGSAEAGGCGCQ